jgi:hypothetical protein
MPSPVSRMNVSATSSSFGNSRAGKMPSRATNSQIPNTTMNGIALRMGVRHHAPGLSDLPDAAGNAPAVAAGTLSGIDALILRDLVEHVRGGQANARERIPASAISFAGVPPGAWDVVATR